MHKQLLIALLTISCPIFGMETTPQQTPKYISDHCIQSLNILLDHLGNPRQQSSFGLYLIAQTKDIIFSIEQCEVDTRNKKMAARFNTLLHLITQQAIDLDRALYGQKITIEPIAAYNLISEHLLLIDRLTQTPTQRRALKQQNLNQLTPVSMALKSCTEAPNVWNYFVSRDFHKLLIPAAKTNKPAVKNEIEIETIVDEDDLPQSDTIEIENGSSLNPELEN